MTNTTDAAERVRGCLADGVTPSLRTVRELLADRDRLHAVYKAASAALEADDSGIDRDGALFKLAAIIGAYEGGALP
jgi:hypothetical protein